MNKPSPKCVYLDRGDNVQCTINLFGANVISWVVFGVEQLFASRKTVYNNLKPIKGGIMLIFPNYKYWSIGPADGFASLMTWKVSKGPTKLPPGDIQVVLELEQGQVSNNIWNFVYRIEYTITLLEREMHFNIEIVNSSPYSFYFHFLFSSHIRVPSLENCRVIGLQDSTYIDKIKDEYLKITEEEELSIEGEYCRTFVSTQDELKLTNVMVGRELLLTKTNLPDIILRSPGEEKANVMEDFSQDEWNKMLIIEVGHRYMPVIIYSKDTFQCSMKLKVKSDAEEEENFVQFY